MVSECEKASGPGLGPAHKKKLCESSTGVGPAQCAVAAKGLHLSVDEVVRLCHGAVNEAPAECMLAMPNAERKRHGFDLCTNTVSSVQHECFNTLTTRPFRGTHLLVVSDVVEFCASIEDAGALACMQAIPDVGLGPSLPAKLGLLPSACRQSSLYVYPAGTTRNVTTGKPVHAREVRSSRSFLESLTFWRSGSTPNKSPGFMEDVVSKRLAVLACLEELKHTFSPSTLQADRFGARETLEFCMHSNKRTMGPNAILPKSLFFGDRLDKLEQKRRHLEPEFFRNYLSECAIRMGHIKNSPKSEKKMFSAAQRLQICEGLDTHNGPYNCAFSLVSATTGKDTYELNAKQIVSLCSGAGGIDRDSEVQVRADARIEEIRVKKLRSSDKRERDAAQESKRHAIVNSYRSLGLGPALCFLDSRSIGISAEERIELCAGAEGSGPAQCYRKAASALRMATHSEKLILCVGAESADPAECAHTCPHYLSMSERIHVCSGAPRDRASEPVKCLKSIEGPSHLLKDAPKRSIGSFSVHIRSPEEIASREILIHMCSFDGSKQPLAAAECLKSAPTALSHDNVVRTCTNTSTADLFSRVSLCQRLLPRDWTLDEATALCNYSEESDAEDPLEKEINEKVEAEVAQEEGREPRVLPNKPDKKKPSAEEVRATTVASVRCAVDMNRFQTYRPAGVSKEGKSTSSVPAALGSWSRVEASALCRKEHMTGVVRLCAMEAKSAPSVSAQYNAQFISPNIITQVCHSVVSAGIVNFDNSQAAKARLEAVVSKAGACLSRLAATGSKGFVFADGVAESICSATDPSFVLRCLEDSSKKRVRVDFSDVHECLNQPRLIERAQFATLQAQDGAPYITAGQRFSVTFDLVDQYGISFYDDTDLRVTEGGNTGASGRTAPQVCSGDKNDSDDYLAHISINEDNEQGSVLWGTRTNGSACGSILFSNLILTQPGSVTFKLTSSLRRISDVSESKQSTQTILIVVSYAVRANPELGTTSGRCLFLFREGVCDSNAALGAKINATANTDTEEVGDSAVGGTVLTRMFLPVTDRTYLKFLTCAPTFDLWHIDWHASSSGFWADYRTGIDAIWTGHGLPRDDMSYAEVLGLSRDIIDQAVKSDIALKSNSTDSRNKRSREGTKRTGKVSRLIRRAYYRKSLQWHPDRWVGMSIYSLIVKSAFEIVTLAHDNLQKMLEYELASAKGKKVLPTEDADPLTPGNTEEELFA